MSKVENIRKTSARPIELQCGLPANTTDANHGLYGSVLSVDANAYSHSDCRHARDRRRFSEAAIANLPEPDRTLFQVFGQGTHMHLPYKCIHHAFEDQAHTRPHAIAAIHGTASISYRQLDEQAERLAALLALQGVIPKDLKNDPSDRHCLCFG